VIAMIAEEPKGSLRVRSHADDANYRVYYTNSDGAKPEAILAGYRAKSGTAEGGTCGDKEGAGLPRHTQTDDS